MSSLDLRYTKITVNFRYKQLLSSWEDLVITKPYGALGKGQRHTQNQAGVHLKAGKEGFQSDEKSLSTSGTPGSEHQRPSCAEIVLGLQDGNQPSLEAGSLNKHNQH